jgi:hypothetical protein
MSERSGQCLCGAVTLRAEISGAIQACHCVQCQRWTGGGPYLGAAASDVRINGGETVAAYHASKWGERAVCGTCGSTLYWCMQGQEPRSIAAGLLDDQTGLSVTEEIFVDYRPEWLEPFEGATQSTEAQEMAKLEEFLAEQKP